MMNSSSIPVFRRATYDVRGIPGSSEFPYVNYLATLGEAIAIAKTYPDVYGDGSATHVIRRFQHEYPEGYENHHLSGFTLTGNSHRWRVFQDGRRELLISYGTWRQRKGVDQWRQSLPLPPNSDIKRPLKSELNELYCLATKFGFHQAADFLRAAKEQLPKQNEPSSLELPVDALPLDLSVSLQQTKFRSWLRRLFG